MPASSACHVNDASTGMPMESTAIACHCRVLPTTSDALSGNAMTCSTGPLLTVLTVTWKESACAPAAATTQVVPGPVARMSIESPTGSTVTMFSSRESQKTVCELPVVSTLAQAGCDVPICMLVGPVAKTSEDRLVLERAAEQLDLARQRVRFVGAYHDRPDLTAPLDQLRAARRADHLDLHEDERAVAIAEIDRGDYAEGGGVRVGDGVAEERERECRSRPR